MKNVRPVLLLLLTVMAIFFAFRTYQLEHKKVQLKEDLIELSKIQYGLFSVNEWKIILAEIITKKVDEFNLDDADRDEMKKKISSFLTIQINELEERYYADNSKSIKGFLQVGVAKVTGTFDQIKKDIPIFTEQIVGFLSDNKNRESVRKYLVKKLDEYAGETFADTDYTKVNQILTHYNYDNIPAAKVYLQESIDATEEQNRYNKIALAIVATIALLLILIPRNIQRFELGIFLVLCFIYLVLGVLLPMIQIDARIGNMTFNLLGENVEFTNQVLYFKSKSILEVVQLMVFQKKLEVLLVGLLVLTFSVLFPLVKLVSSFNYLFNPKRSKNAFIYFMVFKSGKWSMADVMVIAVFMAYIGFDGIITEQLIQLEKIATNLDLLTTNQSSLLFGFYSFTIFVLLSLFASQKLQGMATTR